jgi:hypothetical protein
MFKKCIIATLAFYCIHHHMTSIHMDGNRILTMKRRPEPVLKLQVYLPAWLKQEIEREAKEDGRTLSVCVQRALTEHFKAKEAANLVAMPGNQ